MRVPRQEGERTRQRLADADLIDRRFRIEAAGGSVYIPIRTPGVLEEEYDIVDREPTRRKQQTLPRDLLDEPPSYERLGEIALIDEDEPGRAEAVADAIVDSALPIRAVLNSQSKIQGEERVREWELVAGEDTETVHREFGAEFVVDVTSTYFSPRLATERHRVVSQIGEGECVFDMFAGVGPFLIPAAMAGASGVGVDINPAAIAYLEENARRNGVADRITAIEGDVREVAAGYERWADRIIMNLPHRAGEFLETAGTIAGDQAVVHYYDIQPEDDPFGPGRAAIDRALADRFGIEVLEERVVRSYAPHEVNVCLDVRLEREA